MKSLFDVVGNPFLNDCTFGGTVIGDQWHQIEKEGTLLELQTSGHLLIVYKK